MSRLELLFLMFIVAVGWAGLVASPATVSAQVSPTPAITEITLSPDLDVSLFSPYTATVTVGNYSSSDPMSIDVSGLNGDGDEDPWDFYADGTPDSETLTFTMDNIGGGQWQKTNIYPDYIYPEIFFVPSEITWYNSPLITTVQRNSYQLLHFNNPFTMTEGMSFWIELNVDPRAANSADLQVFLVDKNLDTFNSDWRSSIYVEQVGAFTASTLPHHTHTANSSHYLVPLTAGAGGLVGTKNLDVSGDFWVIIYNNSPNNNRGWDLRYHTNSCTVTSRWLRGAQAGWTTTSQVGCPDVHIHAARRAEIGGIRDGVKLVAKAGELASLEQTFYFNEIPNLPPNATSFTSPMVGGTYAGDITVSWSPATDPNSEDLISYNITLYSADLQESWPLATASGTTSLIWPTDATDNGLYTLVGEVCDDADPQLCTDFNLGDTFTVSNSAPIYSLSSISIVSDNADSTTALTGDTVTLSFTSTGELTNPAVAFYANGESVNDVVLSNNINDHQATFVVEDTDPNGLVSFTIDADNLDQRYQDTTNSSSVVIDNPIPTSTPTPTPTLTPTLTPTSTPTNTPTPTSTPTITPTSTPTHSPTPIPTNTPANTPTPSVQPTPYATSTPANTESEDPDQDSNEPSPQTCSAISPVDIPDLFQIIPGSQTATLFFTPSSSTTEYYISFSTKANAEEHGELVKLNREGVQSHTVFYLRPNTTYFFKVRAHNECAPGEWGNILEVKTAAFGWAAGVPSFRYWRAPSQQATLLSATTQPAFQASNAEQSDHPVVDEKLNIPQLSPTPISLPTETLLKKHCFLWWCW